MRRIPLLAVRSVILGCSCGSVLGTLLSLRTLPLIPLIGAIRPDTLVSCLTGRSGSLLALALHRSGALLALTLYRSGSLLLALTLYRSGSLLALTLHRSGSRLALALYRSGSRLALTLYRPRSRLALTLYRPRSRLALALHRSGSLLALALHRSGSRLALYRPRSRLALTLRRSCSLLASHRPLSLGSGILTGPACLRTARLAVQRSLLAVLRIIYLNDIGLFLRYLLLRTRLGRMRRRFPGGCGRALYLALGPCLALYLCFWGQAFSHHIHLFIRQAAGM